MKKGFFAYPSQPTTLADTIRSATKKINAGQIITLTPWESCRVNGKLIINEICKQIDEADLFCADLTGINPNVLFELGYAISKNKRVWLLLDASRKYAQKHYEQMRTLTTVGYSSYTSHLDIESQFYEDQPYEDLKNTIYENVIQKNLTHEERALLLYLKSYHNTDSSIRITRRLGASKIPLATDDPRESAANTLSWYGAKVFCSTGVVCHLTGPEREGGDINNARYSFVAGMAYGMKKPLIILSEGNYLSPLDYRDLHKHYNSADEALKHVDDWLTPLEKDSAEVQTTRQAYRKKIKLAHELTELKLGEYVAENESVDLVNDYFVETSAYLEALSGKHTIFVGRKGSGKSANLLKLSSELKQDVRNLVCVIKPTAYRIAGVIELLKKYKGIDAKGYALESLWKFLLISEVALNYSQELEMRPAGNLNSAELKLMELLKRDQGFLKSDFSVRLEKCVDNLIGDEKISEESGGLEAQRKAISEMLHKGILKELILALKELLPTKKRVSILIDNLDKAWDRQEDITVLSEILLGLLSVSKRIGKDLKSAGASLEEINVSVTLFMRSDIFYKLLRVAREPDKIQFHRLSWEDPEMLIRVVEERLTSVFENSVPPSEIWDRYFDSKVGEMPPREYFARQILHRPRDILYFVKASIAVAVNRGHAKVEESDILEAEKSYSQHALESILVENGVSLETLENIIYEFAGSTSIVTQGVVEENILTTNLNKDKLPEIINNLCTLTFLGVELSAGEFSFNEDPRDLQRNMVIARKYAQSRKEDPRFKIHRAFWPFLGIKDAPP